MSVVTGWRCESNPLMENMHHLHGVWGSQQGMRRLDGVAAIAQSLGGIAEPTQELNLQIAEATVTECLDRFITQ